MNRTDLQTLADLRLKEGRVLVAGGHFSGGYYLLGYCIECALKACIAKRTNQHDYPDKKLANDCYCHDLEKLIGIAGLQKSLDTEMQANGAFGVSWSIVKDWSEEARYRAGIDKSNAESLEQACGNPTNGVLAWVKKHW
jgi:hypothetical protein